MTKAALGLWLAGLAAACGGKAVIDPAALAAGGQGGTTSTTSTSGTSTSTTSTGSGGGLPADCVVPTSEPPPYQVSLHLTNATSAWLYLRQTCVLELDVRACADDYNASLAIHPGCSVDCIEEPDVCIDCGACPEQGVAIGPGESTTTDWAGLTYVFAQNTAGCDCHYVSAAPASRYLIRVPVYASEEAAAYGSAPDGISELEFELPTAGGAVVVPLSL